MLIPIPKRRNAFAYLLWNWLLKKNGAFSTWNDAYFFGPSHGINDYDTISQYKNSHSKPDKQYSILPTVIQLAGSCANKIVVDLGCGTGFFTVPFAKHGALHVYGIDNSKEQLALAYSQPNITYVLRDVFVDSLPRADVIIAPFVANYARTLPILRHFFQKLYNSLEKDGIAVFVIDFPNNRELKRFGAIKKIIGNLEDGALISIELFNNEEKICELSAFYFNPATIEKELKNVGFKEIEWHSPIISDEGQQRFGRDFWKNYLDDPELGYLTVKKS